MHLLRQTLVIFSRCPSTVSRTVWKRKRVNFRRNFLVSPTEKERKCTFVRVQIEYGFDCFQVRFGLVPSTVSLSSQASKARPRATRKTALGQRPRYAPNLGSKEIWISWNGPNTVSESTVQTPNSVSFFCPLQVPGGRTQWVPFSLSCVCQSELTEFFQNSPSLAQNSVSSLFRNSTLETVFCPFPRVWPTPRIGDSLKCCSPPPSGCQQFRAFLTVEIPEFQSDWSDWT